MNRKTFHGLILSALIIATSLLLPGCSTETTPTVTVPVTSTDDPDLRCKSIDEEFSQDSDFWNYAYENIPTVTIDEVYSGDYDFSYVCIDAVIAKMNKVGDTNYITVVYQMEDGTYCDDTFDIDTSGDVSCKYGYSFDGFGLKSTIKICIYVHYGELDSAILGIQAYDFDSSLDVDEYLESKSNVVETEAETETEILSDNPLMNASVLFGWVTSGDGSELLGRWGYINMAKSEMENITSDQYIEFVESVVKDSGYNWFSILFEDGTGIEFAGCYIYNADYGTVDDEGCITDLIGTIDITSGTCVYTES